MRMHACACVRLELLEVLEVLEPFKRHWTGFELPVWTGDLPAGSEAQSSPQSQNPVSVPLL